MTLCPPPVSLRGGGPPLQLALWDLHLHRVGLGHHHHRYRRGVDATLRLGGGHPLDAVDAPFVLEPGVGAGALDLELDLVETADPGLLSIHHRQLPALGLGPASVHAEEVGCEQGRLLPSFGSLDLHHHVALVVGVARQQQNAKPLLQVGQPLPGSFFFGTQVLLRGRVPLSPQELASSFQLGLRLLVRTVCLDQLLQAAKLLAQPGQALGVPRHLRSAHLLL